MNPMMREEQSFSRDIHQWHWKNIEMNITRNEQFNRICFTRPHWHLSLLVSIEERQRHQMRQIGRERRTTQRSQSLNQRLNKEEEKRDQRTKFNRRTRKETTSELLLLRSEKNCLGRRIEPLLIKGERIRSHRDPSGIMPSDIKALGLWKVRFCSIFRWTFNAFVNRSIVSSLCREISMDICSWKKRFRFFSIVGNEKSSPSANRSNCWTKLDENKIFSLFLTWIRPNKFKIGFVIIGNGVRPRIIEIQHCRTLLQRSRHRLRQMQNRERGTERPKIPLWRRL